MDHFKYRNEELFCEDVPVATIAKAVGTPFYLYSHATLRRHFLAFETAFEDVDPLICYSAKANSSLAVLSLFAELGCGLDIVSGGELYRGLKAGFAPECIVYSGVGKRVDEIDDALNADILMFNVESLQELELIQQRAVQLDRRARISIRVNPDVDPKTHPYTATGLKKNKFGIDSRTAVEAYRLAAGYSHVDIVGIDCHIGSQITEAGPFEDALANLMALIEQLEGELGFRLQYLDMGGGLGITYADEKPPAVQEYARRIIERMQDSHLRLVLEPGRVFVGNAGILVTEVLYLKSGETKNFVIVDAGMNDLLRPTLYQAYHTIEPVVKSKRVRLKADVVGPICESGDFLAQDRELVEVQRGDLLAVRSAGAYGYVMSSNYCSRPRVAEVMVKEDRFHVVRNREDYRDLTRGESVPPFVSPTPNIRTQP
jgi:diaminopimelate decarboxylase